MEMRELNELEIEQVSGAGVIDDIASAVCDAAQAAIAAMNSDRVYSPGMQVETIGVRG